MFRRHTLILIQHQGQPNERLLKIELLPPTAKNLAPGVLPWSISRPTSEADWGEDGSLRWSLTNNDPADRFQVWHGKWINAWNSVSKRKDELNYYLGSSAHQRYKIYTYAPAFQTVTFLEIAPNSSGYGPLSVDERACGYLRQALVTQNGFYPATLPHGSGFVSIQSPLFHQGQLHWDHEQGAN